MQAALLRYRVLAYVVGVLLLLLAFVAMPLKYAADQPTLVETIGPVHGFAYMVYLVVAFDLSRRAGWSLVQTLLVLLADLVARHLLGEVPLPVGVVTGAVGAPYLLWLLARSRR